MFRQKYLFYLKKKPTHLQGRFRYRSPKATPVSGFCDQISPLGQHSLVWLLYFMTAKSGKCYGNAVTTQWVSVVPSSSNKMINKLGFFGSTAWISAMLICWIEWTLYSRRSRLLIVNSIWSPAFNVLRTASNWRLQGKATQRDTSVPVSHSAPFGDHFPSITLPWPRLKPHPPGRSKWVG